MGQGGVAGRWHLGLIFAVVGCLSGACDAPRSERGSGSAERGGAVPMLRDHVGTERLSPEQRLQFRVSDFAAPNAPRIVAVELQTRGIGRHEEGLEERLMELLRRRAPEPFEIRRRRGLERDEVVWAHLKVTLQRRIERTRKSQRVAHPRVALRMEVTFELRLPRGSTSNWERFHFSFVDERAGEVLVELEEIFWRDLEHQVPTLVVRERAALAKDAAGIDWARRLGFRAELAEGVLQPMLAFPMRALFREGCAAVVKEHHVELIRLDNPFAPGIVVNDGAIAAARCDARGAYIAVHLTDRAVDVFYRTTSQVQWRTRVSFENAVDPGRLRFVAGGEQLCLVGERVDLGFRYAKIVCFHPETGAVRWEWTEPGADIKALALRQGRVFLAAGRHVRVLSQEGKLLWHAVVEGGAVLDERSGACMIEEKLIFSHRLGRVFALDMDTGRGLWEITTFGRRPFFCDDAHGLYLDEAGALLVAIDTAQMEAKWRFRHGGQIVDALAHNGMLLLLLPRAIYVLGIENGNVYWQIPLPVYATAFHRYARRLLLEADGQLYELTDEIRHFR